MQKSSFPLLKLPFLAIDKVFKIVNPRDLIDLTMISSKFKKTLELHQLSVFAFHVIIGAAYTGISIECEKSMDIEAYYPMDPFEPRSWKIRKIDGEDVMSISCGFERKFKAKNKTNEAKMQLLETLCSHLLSFLKVEHFNFSCRREMNFSQLFFWKFTQNLGFLKVVPIADSQLQVSPEDLKFLLEELTTAHLQLRVYCPGTKYSNSIKSEVIHIDDSSWVDFKNISIDSETTHVDFYIKQEIDESDINRLIKEWIEGKSEKLVYLRFSWRNFIGNCKEMTKNYGKISFWKILDGLVQKRTQFTDNQLFHRGAPYYNSKNDRDVQRFTDGRLATIIQDTAYCNISLAVWDEKHLRAAKEHLREFY